LRRRRRAQQHAFSIADAVGDFHSACQYKRCILAVVFKRNIRLSFTCRFSEAAQLSNSHRAQPNLRSGT
jgi:hypothetical protein